MRVFYIPVKLTVQEIRLTDKRRGVGARAQHGEAQKHHHEVRGRGGAGSGDGGGVVECVEIRRRTLQPVPTALFLAFCSPAFAVGIVDGSYWRATVQYVRNGADSPSGSAAECKTIYLQLALTDAINPFRAAKLITHQFHVVCPPPKWGKF